MYLDILEVTFLNFCLHTMIYKQYKFSGIEDKLSWIHFSIISWSTTMRFPFPRKKPFQVSCSKCIKWWTADSKM